MRKSVLPWLAGALIAALTSPALAAAQAPTSPRVLVFTGTAGQANPATAPAAQAIQTLGAANGFAVDVTPDATAISTGNLARYRAVAFVNAEGDVLGPVQQVALQGYVQEGGGFVGIGGTARLEAGEPFFDKLIGARPATAQASPQDVTFIDRVHPASRANAPLLKAHADTYYDWVSNPAGKVHTVARATSPVSWCRDMDRGRSFYTALGGTADAYGEPAVTRQLLGALQWAAGLVRGNCKATIDTSYSASRLTTTNADELAIADDGRVFSANRAACDPHTPDIVDWNAAGVGKGCGTISVLDPSGSEAKIASLDVFGAKGNGAEYGANSRSQHGILGLALDPAFSQGRPYVYVQYTPYNRGALGPGFDRLSLMGERRVSRFTYDPSTKTLGAEKVVFHWMTPVYACCNVGGALDFDSAGNLYIATGDTTAAGPNGGVGSHTNAHPNYTVPVDGSVRANHDTTPGGGVLSFADARGTAANSNAYEGKLLRIKPLADPGAVPGLGSTYTIPGANAPNGPNLFAASEGKAKPEIFAMGFMDLRSLDVDRTTDAISAAWKAGEQAFDTPNWGPAGGESAALLGAAGNYGWPYCQAGNRFAWRAKLPAIGGGIPATGSEVRGTVDGFWDCTKALANDSPFNTGLADLPAPKPANAWSTSAEALTAGTYHRGTNGNWPAYWDGRWFTGRRALLMDPATATTGGLPIAADSLAQLLPATINDLDFGPDGALYVAGPDGVTRIAYNGGPDTPGPDPHATVVDRTVTFDSGRSGGVSYEWSFPDGTTATGATVTHTFADYGKQTATLTVTYADGTKASRTVEFDVPAPPTLQVSADVPLVLQLTIGSPARFPTMIPGVAATYSATTTASVLSTAGEAKLTVTDADPINPGRLVNAPSVMPQPLSVRATNASHPGNAFGALSNTPLTLLTWDGPATSDPVTLTFQQPVDARDALRAGAYSKSLTFTLSTTTP